MKIAINGNIIDPENIFIITPIKGEITPGKLKWRGVKLVQTREIGNYSMFIEQRGKRICEVISLKNNF